MNIWRVVRDFFVLTFATLIVAAAVFFFLMPSHASVSSVAGLAIVLANFIPFSVSEITLGINVILLIFGFALCGREFGIKTVYTALLMPVFMGMFEKLLPNYTSLTNDATLDVICYIVVVSVGVSILFTENSSSGGVDIIAKIMNKYLKIDFGRASSIAGAVIALSSILVYDSKTVILSILGTYANGYVIDHFIFNRSLKRRVCVSSPEHEKIREFIVNTLHSGATMYEAIGAFKLKKHIEIITIVDKNEYQKLMAFIQEVDPQAFVTVYRVSNMSYRSKQLEERQF